MYKTILVFFVLSVLISCKKEDKEVVENVEVEIKEDAFYLSKEIINFPSKDSLMITADVYKVANKPIAILLCHQAGFSRGEYNDTAIKLNELGYSVMAIDQRSGNKANKVINETAKRAKAKNLPTTYLDAKQDIEAAVSYILKDNGNKSILLVGSSYSATLALLIGNENDKVNAVAAFSPGEYFKGMDIQGEIKNLDKPVYVTASNSETEALSVLISKMNNKNLTHYKPLEKGIHGSRALWVTTDGYEGYWKSFKIFLNKTLE